MSTTGIVSVSGPTTLPPFTAAEKPPKKPSDDSFEMEVCSSDIPGIIREIRPPWDFILKSPAKISLSNKPGIKERIEGIIERLHNSAAPVVPVPRSTGSTLEMEIPFSDISVVFQEIGPPWNVKFGESVKISVPNKPGLKDRIDSLIQSLAAARLERLKRLEAAAAAATKLP